jgi:hypothetical protein
VRAKIRRHAFIARASQSDADFFKQRGFGLKVGLGERPALLVIDMLIGAFLHERRHSYVRRLRPDGPAGAGFEPLHFAGTALPSPNSARGNQAISAKCGGAAPF